VDFTYEVEKSLRACEGALLLIDVTQGVESQTIANYYLAIDNNLEILPVINKVDIANADIDEAKRQFREVLKFKRKMCNWFRQKKALISTDCLRKIIAFIPPPEGDPQAPLKALVFDMKYDIYKGIIIYVRLMEGSIKAQTKILL